MTKDWELCAANQCNAGLTMLLALLGIDPGPRTQDPGVEIEEVKAAPSYFPPLPRFLWANYLALSTPARPSQHTHTVYRCITVACVPLWTSWCYTDPDLGFM